MESGAPSTFTTSANVVWPSVIKATCCGVRGVLMVRRATLHPVKGKPARAVINRTRKRYRLVTMSVSKGPETELHPFRPVGSNDFLHRSLATDQHEQIVAFNGHARKVHQNQKQTSDLGIIPVILKQIATIQL